MVVLAGQRFRQVAASAGKTAATRLFRRSSRASKVGQRDPDSDPEQTVTSPFWKSANGPKSRGDEGRSRLRPLKGPLLVAAR